MQKKVKKKKLFIIYHPEKAGINILFIWFQTLHKYVYVSICKILNKDGIIYRFNYKFWFFFYIIDTFLCQEIFTSSFIVAFLTHIIWTNEIFWGFLWSICLSLCISHTVLITITSWYILKSGSVMVTVFCFSRLFWLSELFGASYEF